MYPSVCVIRWYREACPPILHGGTLGPSSLTATKRVSPLLLRLTWDGMPLYFVQQLGWGWICPSIVCEQVETKGEKDIEVDEDGSPRVPTSSGVTPAAGPLSQEELVSRQAGARHFFHALQALTSGTDE